tara:strand:+ start:7950 stop:8936 length:987 start_codon:yes stop_codon:yes gene_type:complete
MATDFKYASQSDMQRYVGDIVADADNKRQVYNFQATDTTNQYQAFNTGFIEQLFFDGIEGTSVDDDPNANYEYNWSAATDSVQVFISTADPNDMIIEAGFDNATYYDQMLVDASMELNNLLDARFPVPLPKYDQYDANTTHSAATKEYDALIIKVTCYLAASNALRAIGEIEKADYYYDLVTNAERTGVIDRLNAGEFKLAFEIDSSDSQGKVRTITKSGSMDVVETAGEWSGENYDVCRITCTTTGAYGTAIVKAETYGNDKLFGTTTENIKVSGTMDSIVNGLYIRFQGASMTQNDQWEVTVTNENRKRSNPMTSGINLTRGARGI